MGTGWNQDVVSVDEGACLKLSVRNRKNFHHGNDLCGLVIQPSWLAEEKDQLPVDRRPIWILKGSGQISREHKWAKKPQEQETAKYKRA
jgi:hypothetical protein